MPPPYVYEPLRKGHIIRKQCIRLVHLLPGPKKSKMRIFIERAPVESSWPRYEALSYTWGDQSNPHSIEVVSELPKDSPGIFHRSRPQKEARKNSTIRVGANLASALIHLRRQNTTRVLWIDAICLDQENNVEKSLEICKMGEIYAKAKSVVIWLGTGSESTVKAFQAMSHLGRQVNWDAGKNQVLPVKDCDEEWKNWQADDFVVPFDQETWFAIEKVILSEWFRRVWIWQEICLANHNSAITQCGASFMPWKTFLNAVAFFNIDPDSGAVGHRERFKASLKPVTNLALIPSNRHLLGLLGVTRRCGCSVPSDRIYGLLGLATRAEVPENLLLETLAPNYDKSTAQVYEHFAEREITLMRRLSILWHCDAVAWSSELPSWVPDWNVELLYRNLNLGIFGGGRGALGRNDSFGTIKKDMLTVKSVICDTVSSCSATVSNSATVTEMSSVIRSFCEALDTNKTPSDETLEALCHALTVGYIGERYPEAFRPANLQAAKQMIKNILSPGRTVKSSRNVPPPEAPLVFHMSDALPNRKLFITNVGRIGLGPSKTEPCDVVVSIIGSQRLMMLRAEPRGFRIVGVCYLHGFMEMEAILGPLPQGYSVQLVGPCINPWDMRFVSDGKASPQDPRLERTHEGWRSDRRDGDGAIFWDNVARDIATKSDPRHTDVEFLKKRGVPVVEICIV